MWFSLGLSKKILLIFFTISIVPLVALNTYWLRVAQDEVEEAAINRQIILLSETGQRISSKLQDKLDDAIATSQNVDVTNLDISPATITLLQYSVRDNDVARVSLVDAGGDERVIIEDNALVSKKRNIRDLPEFDVVSLRGNEPQLSEVSYTDDSPFITVSVPLLAFNELGDQNLTSGDSIARRVGSDINGALIVKISVEDIFREIVEAKLGEDGYLFLVDSTGRVLAHPNEQLTRFVTNLNDVEEVGDAIRIFDNFNVEGAVAEYTPEPAVSPNESGASVLTSNFPIAPTEWAIIGEEPTTSVFSAIGQIATLALLVLMIIVPIATILVFIGARSILQPIQELTESAIEMGAGRFDKHIKVRGSDELARLAATFNSMADDVSGLIQRLQFRNQSLVSEQTKLRAILNTITDGVIVLDEEYKIVLANNTVAEMVGQKNILNLVGKQWLEKYPLLYDNEEFTNEKLGKGIQVFRDMTLQNKDHPLFIDLTAVHVQNDPNNIAYILTIQDITERRELETMKMDFVSMAAHELRTPETAIRGYLDLLTDSELSEEERERFVTLANINASTLENIINNMLSLSKIERNSMEFTLHKVDWKKTVHDAVNSLRFSAEARSMDIQLELPPDDVFVLGDQVSLREVVGNLLSNAIHYSDEGKVIRIEVDINDDDMVWTRVIDQGIGIPNKLQEHLFTKYYRTRGGLTTNSQGTGIGLFISKSVVVEHGGEIGVHSVFGEGSTFYFSLRKYKEPHDRHPDKPGDNMKQRSKVDWF